MGDIKQILDEIKKKRTKIYHILTFDLSIARADELVQITGTYLYILFATGTANIKFNETSEDLVDLIKFRSLKVPFYRFYLTNIAQAGTSLKIAVGVESDLFEVNDMGASVAGGVLTEATSPTIYNVTCTVAGTEYSQALGECRKFLIRPRTGNLKVCFASGQSGTTFITNPSGGAYNEDSIHPTALTLYFQNDTAGAVAEIVKWL